MKYIDDHIITECYVDTNLLETICPPNSGGYNHQKGNSKVAKVMNEKFADDFCIGMVDKDKQELDYLLEFDCVYESEDMLLHKHKNRLHFIIQIVPAIESWTLKQAQIADIDLSTFNIPTELKAFIKKSKSATTTKYDKDFKNAFRSLLFNKAPSVVRLKSWIDYLKNKNYAAELTEML